MDKIFIHALKTETIVGIFDWERQVKQTVIVDIEFSADIAKAALSDSIDDTLNYKGVAKRVLAFVDESQLSSGGNAGRARRHADSGRIRRGLGEYYVEQARCHSQLARRRGESGAHASGFGKRGACEPRQEPDVPPALNAAAAVNRDDLAGDIRRVLRQE